MSKQSLDSAKEIKNDEFYTTNESVIRIFNEFKFYDEFDFTNYYVWCPFDKRESPFITELEKFDRGIEILHSHIDDGGDFFQIYEKVKIKAKKDNKKLLLLSNPPFSKLRQIMEFINEDVKNKIIDFIFIIPQTFFTTKLWSENCHKWYINNLNIRKFNTPDGEKEVQCYLLTSLKEYEKIYATTLKETDDGFDWVYENVHIRVYKSYKFKDLGYDLCAVPVSYLFNQRRGFRVLGLCPRIKIDNKELFARILICYEGALCPEISE